MLVAAAVLTRASAARAGGTVLDRPLGLAECDAYRKLIRCRIKHTPAAERAKVLPKVTASLAGVRRAIREGKRTRKKIAQLCTQHVFEVKRAFGHMAWFGRCLLAIRPCPPRTDVKRGRLGGRKAQWCEKRGRRGRVVKHGPAAEWHANGRLASVGAYRNGRRHGKWTSYFPSNVLRQSEGAYRNGRKHGSWTFFFESGQEKSREQYRRGRRHGRFSSYRSSGRLDFLGAYRNNKKHGIWIHWYRKGRKTMMVTWRRGRKVEVFCYNRKGLAIRTCRYSRGGRKRRCRRMKSSSR